MNADCTIMKKAEIKNSYVLRDIIPKPKDVSDDLYNLFYKIVTTIPIITHKLREKYGEDVPIEISHFPAYIFEDVIQNAEKDIGYLYARAMRMDTKKPFFFSVKELFFVIMLELGISFYEESSKSIISRIVLVSPLDPENFICITPSDIRLSALLKHFYFNSNSYSLNNDDFISICLTPNNRWYYYMVAVLAKHLSVNNMLSIDYDEFYIDEYITPCDTIGLHKHKDSGIYFNNRWNFDNAFFQTKEKNKLTAVLSYVKFKMQFKH